MAGAVEFLRGRPEVDGDRIGGLGLSTGADVLIEFAAQGPDLRAIVSDGATGRSHEDQMRLAGFDFETPYFFPLKSSVGVITSSLPDKPLEKLVANVSPTPLLLVASGNFQNESEYNRIYAEAAREPVELWELPDGNHTAAVREQPDEYERRVIGLFDRALAARR